MPIEDDINQMLKEDSPSSTAVNSLVKASVDDDDVELKTDLSGDQIKIHSVLKMLDLCFNMDTSEFQKKPILGKLINIVERKSWSKDRKSREEIVAVAKQPDVSMSGGAESEGMLKRMFTPRR